MHGTEARLRQKTTHDVFSSEQEHFDPEGRRKNQDWPDVQIEKVAQLVTFLLQEHGLESPDDIKTHAKIAKPNGRKQHPFDYPFEKFHGFIEERTVQNTHGHDPAAPIGVAEGRCRLNSH
jgi:hypothetical protein